MDTNAAGRRFQYYTGEAPATGFSTFRAGHQGRPRACAALQSRTSIGIREMPHSRASALRRSAIASDSSSTGASRLPIRNTQIGAAATLCAAFQASWTAQLINARHDLHRETLAVVSREQLFRFDREIEIEHTRGRLLNGTHLGRRARFRNRLSVALRTKSSRSLRSEANRGGRA